MAVRCDRCGKADLLQVVNVQVQAPFGWRNLSKTGIRRREVKILGADWGRVFFYCPACGPYNVEESDE